MIKKLIKGLLKTILGTVLIPISLHIIITKYSEWS